MRIGAPPQSFRHFPQHQICGAPVGGAEQALHLRVVPVFHLEKVPQEQVARELGVSVRSVQDIKAKAIDALAEMYAFTAGLN